MLAPCRSCGGEGTVKNQFGLIMITCKRCRLSVCGGGFKEGDRDSARKALKVAVSIWERNKCQ